MRPPMVLGLVAGLLLTGVADAAHMTLYRYNPIEHDDVGRSHEPDGASTGVLGPFVENRMLDLPPFNTNPSGGALADPLPYVPTNPLAAQGGRWTELAPGCTTATPLDPAPARAPSGACGLRTVGASPSSVTNVGSLVPGGLVGLEGLPGDAAPGAFTPTKSTPVRFLDGKLTFTASRLLTNLALNEKFADLGVPWASRYPGAEVVVWAWYGEWADRNGNGVIDHFTEGKGGANGANEFTWFGLCSEGFGETRNPASVEAGLCRDDPNPHEVALGACPAPDPTVVCAGTEIYVWFWPGNKHGGDPNVAHLLNFANGHTAPLVLGDLPGYQVVRWGLRGLDCSEPPTCDEHAATYTEDGGYGDPLLDAQDEVIFDDELYDFTGIADDATRQWYGTGGQPIVLYDSGLLTNFLAVYGVNCEEDEEDPNGFVLDTCTFTDVDRHAALNPAIDGLTRGLQRQARGAWLLVRDG